jgi:Domain of unknown function (DUF1877)
MFKHVLLGIGLLCGLALSCPALAGMTWSARAIDPTRIDALKRDDKLLEQTLFGDTRQAEVADTEVDLDKAWHGIHFLLTGGAGSNGSLASKVIMGGESIGPDRGYGPAQLLKPAEVKAIAHLLEETTPDMLRERFKPKEMTRAAVYPGVWGNDGGEGLGYVLDYYKKLVAFYKRAAQRGQAVIFVIS